MNKLFILALFFVVSCSHSKKSPELTSCRVHNYGVYLDFPSCFDSKNPDGTFKVKPEILSQLNFSKTKHISYSDFARTQPKTKVHSGIVKGYILSNGKAHDVIFFDNGADYFEDGMARFISPEGKTGFINEDLKVVIPATHEFVAPFRQGKAYFCDGCALDGKGEHQAVIGGLWGIMNTKGETIKGPLEENKILNK